MTDHASRERMGSHLAAISSGIVSLHKEYYGRGPTGAKTYALNDTIVCLLRGGFTVVEETLMADGKLDEIENLRRSFQRTMKERFTSVVETAIDRKVIGYMSQIHTDPNVAVELFLLAPAPEKLSGEHEFTGQDIETQDEGQPVTSSAPSA